MVVITRVRDYTDCDLWGIISMRLLFIRRCSEWSSTTLLGLFLFAPMSIIQTGLTLDWCHCGAPNSNFERYLGDSCWWLLSAKYDWWRVHEKEQYWEIQAKKQEGKWDLIVPAKRIISIANQFKFEKGFAFNTHHVTTCGSKPEYRVGMTY